MRSQSACAAASTGGGNWEGTVSATAAAYDLHGLVGATPAGETGAGGGTVATEGIRRRP